MSHDTHTASTDASSALADAGHAVENAVQSIRRSASETLPAAGGFISRLVYSTSYTLSYGIVLPVMLIVRVVPKDNAMVQGFADGALAARDRVFGWSDGEAGENGEEPHDEEDSSEPEGSASRKAPRRKGGRRRGSSHSSRRS